MSIEEIINELGRLRFILECNRDRERAETGVFRASSSRLVAINAAISLLRTHPEAQPNDPLTLEELLEIEGEPVYLKVKGDEGHYVMLCGFSCIENAFCFYGEIHRKIEDYGKTWLAYRRRTKED